MHTLKKINSLVVLKNQKIFEVIKKINSSKIKIIFVIDAKKKLIGSISSGDIRRSIRKKINPNSIAEKIMFKKPKFYFDKDEKKIDKDNIDRDLICIPIVNKNMILMHFKIMDDVKKNKRNNTIFLMAGGKGKRLLPLTRKTPKPLLKIKNIPIIEKIIIDFRNQGFSNFIISVNYLAYKIKKYLGNGNRLNVEISYITEKKFLGTAGSLSLADTKKIQSPMIVVNSDLIAKVDYNNLLNYHLKRKSDLTICAKNKIFEMPYGEIVLNDEKVKKIIEKPISNNLVNAGIYVVNGDMLKNIKKNQRTMMNDFITYLIKKNKNVLSYPIYENWIDIGNKLDFYNASK